MTYRPIPAKLTRIGNSVSVFIPKMFAQASSFEAGQMLWVRLFPGGEYFQLRARPAGRDGLAVLIPKSILTKYGLKLGDTIPVPFLDWHAVDGNNSPDAAESSEDQSPQRAGAKRDKKSPRTRAQSRTRGGDEDHEHRSYAARPTITWEGREAVPFHHLHLI